MAAPFFAPPPPGPGTRAEGVGRARGRRAASERVGPRPAPVPGLRHQRGHEDPAGQPRPHPSHRHDRQQVDRRPHLDTTEEANPAEDFYMSVSVPCSIGGHPVRQGTRVLVNMWSIHHDPQHWDKPDLFNPGNNCQTTFNTFF